MNLVKPEDLCYSPTPEQLMFKEFIVSKFDLETLQAFLKNPDSFADRIFPFDIKAVKKWLEQPTFCTWLLIEDLSNLYLELKRMEYIRELEYTVETLDELNFKVAQVKIKGLETLLKLQDKRKIQKESKELTEALQSLPKSLARLSNFEIQTNLKQLEELLDEKRNP